MVSFARVLWIVAGCALVSACSGTAPEITPEPRPGETDTEKEPEGPGAESGTRLRARYAMGTDGSKEFVGWFDKQRNEECSIKAAESGKLRCLPTAHPVFDYSDAECTKPIVTLPPQLDCNGNPPKYIMAMDYTQACIPSAKLFEIGAATQVMVDPVYRSQQGGCEPVGSGAMMTFYEVGAEVPMSEMVEAEIVTQ